MSSSSIDWKLKKELVSLIAQETLPDELKFIGIKMEFLYNMENGKICLM